MSPASVEAERRSSLVAVVRKAGRRDWGGVLMTTKSKLLGRNISDGDEDVGT